MAHFAKLDDDNVVVDVVVVSNADAVSEQAGIDFLIGLLGESTWVQCSYNSNIRKQYPGVGYTYDPIADVFVAPSPGPGWSLNENHDWVNPDAPRQVE
jgi:hypothetical protein